MDKQRDITAKYAISDGDRTPIHEEEHTIDSSAKHVSDPDAGKSDEERAAIVRHYSTYL